MISKRCLSKLCKHLLSISNYECFFIAFLFLPRNEPRPNPKNKNIIGHNAIQNMLSVMKNI